MGRKPRAKPGGSRAADDSSRFPLLVAGLSTLAALLLFFSATVSAIAEHRFLRQVAAEREARSKAMTDRLEAESLHRICLLVDVQSLLVELDQRGVGASSLLDDPGTGSGGDDHR